MYRKNNLNDGSRRTDEILLELPLRGAITDSQSDQQAEGLHKAGNETEERSSALKLVAQTSTNTSSVFTNHDQFRLAEARRQLLDSAPLAIRKPLCLIDDHAYAVTWLHTKQSTNGNELRQLILRDDGIVFGEGFEELKRSGLEVYLSEMPKQEKLLSKSGFIGFLDGERPKAADVFNRVAQTVDRFMDFNRSLADQQVMCDLIACYILSTWFLDAFNVIGFVWPNGVRGSGKTQLLNVVAELGYLGEMILTGSTFASLRDLADYGATLCFDDAESVANQKRMDGDKRALLLAGNRRGSTVTLKERQGPNENWRNRRVNTFCPRLFSAIGSVQNFV